MAGNYKVIDENNWKRALHCQIFRNSIEPSFCVTFELDITNFLARVREMNHSFTMALIFVVSKCANEIEEFRYRFIDGQIVLYDRIDTAFTYMDKDTELFKVVNVEMKDTLEEYVAIAIEMAKNQKAYFTGPLMYFSFRQCLGCHILISHIRTQGKKIMLHLSLIGVNISKEMITGFFRFLFKCTIPL